MVKNGDQDNNFWPRLKSGISMDQAKTPISDESQCMLSALFLDVQLGDSGLEAG
jgi:hypothetical protein